MWAAGQGSPTVANMPRTARRLERRQFKSWTHRQPWEVHWLSLDAGEQEAWNEFAEVQLLHKLTGRPSLVSGKEFFITYWSQATLFNGSEPASPWEVPDAPEWNSDNAPFEPWLDPAEGMAVVVKSETTEDRTFFFVGQPPSANKGRLSRATCVPLGTFTLAASVAGTRWAAPAAAATALFGAEAESESSQQWFLAWELSGWFPRPVLDPCYTPPVGDPPPEDPCWPVLPGSVSVTGAGGVPSGAYIWDTPVACIKQTVDGVTKYVGTGTSIVNYTDGGGFLGTVSIVIERQGTSPDSAWTFTQSQSTPYDGQCAGQGTVGTAEGCAAPVADGVWVEGPSLYGYTTFALP